MNEAKWISHDATVQAFRASMIASQSFLLAVSAGFYQKNNWIVMICVFIALFQLWYIWYRVIRVRTIIADYYRFDLASKFCDCGEKMDSCGYPLKEKTYIHNPTIRRKVNSKLADDYDDPLLKHNFRPTRIKLDLLLPITFSILWFCILFSNSP